MISTTIPYNIRNFCVIASRITKKCIWGCGISLKVFMDIVSLFFNDTTNKKRRIRKKNIPMVGLYINNSYSSYDTSLPPSLAGLLLFLPFYLCCLLQLFIARLQPIYNLFISHLVPVFYLISPLTATNLCFINFIQTSMIAIFSTQAMTINHHNDRPDIHD